MGDWTHGQRPLTAVRGCGDGAGRAADASGEPGRYCQALSGTAQPVTPATPHAGPCREKVIPEATSWFTGEALLEYEVGACSGESVEDHH